MTSIINSVLLENEEKVLKWLIFCPEELMIWNGGAKIVKRISKEISLNPTVVFQIVKRLEKRGLIEIKETNEGEYIIVDISGVVKVYPQFFSSKK